MTLAEKIDGVCAGAPPVAFATSRARVGRSQLPRAVLVALGVTASACNSDSPSATAASGESAGDGVAVGVGAVGAGEGEGAGATPAAPAASEGNTSEGTRVVAGISAPVTAGDPELAEASAEATSVASVGPPSGSDAGADAASSEPARVVLFDGANLDEWQSLVGGGDASWELPGDGTMVVSGGGNIVTRRTFEDLFVHVEYETPAYPPTVTGQARGNSGVYLNAMYELQVLDSFGLPPMIDGCGAIYGVSAPLVTACFAQEVWNTYEIEFQAARWDAQGNKLAPARVVTATLNGVLVQQGVDIPNSTGSGLPEVPGPSPLMLQDHGNRVAYRNIWVIPR